MKSKDLKNIDESKLEIEPKEDIKEKEKNEKEEKIIDNKKAGKKSTLKKVLLVILAIIIVAVVCVIISICNFFFNNKKYYIGEKKIDIPIFVYHNIVNEINGPEYMQTRADTFENQISGLLKLGYTCITYDDLEKYKNGEIALGNKVFLISFDDGGKENYSIMYPIIKKLNVPVAINIIDDSMGKDSVLTWDEVKEMSDSGLVSIYTHSRYHRDSTTVDTDEYIKDVDYAHDNIEKHLNKEVKKVFTFPYGLSTDDKIERLKQEGYIENLTDNKVNQSETLDLSRLHREYPLSDSVPKMLLKILYRSVRYGG